MKIKPIYLLALLLFTVYFTARAYASLLGESQRYTLYLSQPDVTKLYKTVTKSYPSVHDPSVIFNKSMNKFNVKQHHGSLCLP
jgi:hypothetical protein